MKEQVRGQLISQKDNFKGNFGYVARSSAIFYYKMAPHIRTTISFMDYWSVKRNIEVMIVASTRDVDGSLKLREVLNFANGNVINYRPQVGENFEGSVEIEVFAAQNMVIPYAAIMAIYEWPLSISMVHSYGRTYSPHEIEEKRTISLGRESCWTLRDSAEIRSFCVFHNGLKPQPAQEARLKILNHKGHSREKLFVLNEIPAYGTWKFYPSDQISDLEDFLDGQPGNAALTYELCDSFTRMLVGNETKNGQELQVTHSNFNYSMHQSDKVESGDSAYMNVIDVPLRNPEVIVYPDSSPGDYTVSSSNFKYEFNNLKRLQFSVKPGELLVFKSKSGVLPTRIVTAFSGAPSGDAVLPFECSLGIHHNEYPMKRSHWGVTIDGDTVRGRLILQHQDELFGVPGAGTKTTIFLQSSKRKEKIKRDLSAEELRQLHHGNYLSEIFPEAKAFLGGDYGYFYLMTDYPGLQCYSTLENSHGSLTLEHAF